jgi:lipid-A-disaccharide synthase
VRDEVLVVAGEASGDRIAALVARRLAARGERCFGVGGAACREAGVELCEDSQALAAIGPGEAIARLPRIAKAVARVLARVIVRPPRAALLVNFTEVNQRLGRALRALSIPVLWCVAPQVWAWRPGRLRTVRSAVDRLAVILPFEEALWRGAGVDARYVGHPSLEVPAPTESTRAALRARLGLPAREPVIAVLPGSRAGEIARLARTLAGAAARLVCSGKAAAARVILAPDLAPEARALCLASARAEGLPVVPGDAEHGAVPLLPAFDIALSASGTASLEAALAGAAPVVVYRLDPLSFALARRLVRTPHIGLANVLLGRRAFPELLQDEVTEARITAAAEPLLASPDTARRDALALRALLAPPSPAPFGERVAALLDL